MTDTVLLSVEEMYQADAAAGRAGVPGLALMEAAGAAIFREIRGRWPTPRPTMVLCGPGNNGGDGFVVARLLREAGWPVRLALLGEWTKLKGDAAANAKRWTGDVLPLDGPDVLDGCDLVLDALFGAGLTRPLEGPASAVIEAINQRRLACLAVDVPTAFTATPARSWVPLRKPPSPSPFQGQAGALPAPRTRSRRRPGGRRHRYPGSGACRNRPKTAFNDPGLWLERYPWPNFESNKYTRGHAVIAGGSEMTGAARLAARGARRIGAGLVTIATSPEAFPIYAADLPGTLVKPIAGRGGFRELLADPRRNAVLVGPGAGVNEITHRRALAALGAGKATVLDADALTVFAKKPAVLFEAIDAPCVLTPHEGEFARLFKLKGDRLARARTAARQSGAVVLLKGSDTVIAAPDGRAAIDAAAPPELATGGSGDVLAGLILGLLAQGMDAFGAACAATWIHGSAAADFGPGLIAEDLPERVPGVVRRLRAAAVNPGFPGSE